MNKKLINNVNIVGIGDVTHDASVCISQNGRILCAIEEERLTRVKHGLARNADLYRIDNQGKYLFELLSTQTVAVREKKHQQLIDYCLEATHLSQDEIDFTVISTLYNEWPFRFDGVFIQHHMAHAASAFYPSSFNQAAILVIDGYGVETNERAECGLVCLGENGHIQMLDYFDGYWSLTAEEKQKNSYKPHMVFQNSLGVFYQNVTILLGLGYGGEGKTMGLASYGQVDSTLNIIDEYINFLPQGKIEIDNRSIFSLCETLIQDYTNYDKDKQFQAYANLAYKHQELLNDMMVHMANYCYTLTKQDNLCLAGGVIMNCVANSEILKRTPFKNIFVQPAAGDNGISIGCALYGAHMLAKIPRFYNEEKTFSAYTGKDYTSAEINNVAKEFETSIIELKSEEDIYTYIARVISEGKIVAWFNGGSEIGARALGNRSILADPRNACHRDYLNAEIKNREGFRPFAPAIIKDKVEQFFDDGVLSPYMTFVAKVKSSYIEQLSAITHVDGTARLQTVTKADNEQFYSLLLAFEQLTSFPILLNTSFNVAGQSIVETPKEAVLTFLQTKIDLLVMNGLLFQKISSTAV